MRDEALCARLSGTDFPMTSGIGGLTEVLVAKTGLSKNKAERAVAEYRRFLYLAAVAGEVLAPSPLIDRVWHLHLEDTRAYLNELSEKVIGRVIHHRPGRPNQQDDPAYARTLALYREEFGEEPFSRVWPTQRMLVLRGRGVWFFLLGVLGFASGILLRSPAILVLGFVPMTGAAIVYGIIGPWEVGKSGDGGCGGDGGGDGGGCGGGD